MTRQKQSHCIFRYSMFLEEFTLRVRSIWRKRNFMVIFLWNLAKMECFVNGLSHLYKSQETIAVPGLTHLLFWSQSPLEFAWSLLSILTSAGLLWICVIQPMDLCNFSCCFGPAFDAKHCPAPLSVSIFLGNFAAQTSYAALTLPFEYNADYLLS